MWSLLMSADRAWGQGVGKITFTFHSTYSVMWIFYNKNLYKIMSYIHTLFLVVEVEKLGKYTYKLTLSAQQSNSKSFLLEGGDWLLHCTHGCSEVWLDGFFSFKLKKRDLNGIAHSLSTLGVRVTFCSEATLSFWQNSTTA